MSPRSSFVAASIGLGCGALAVWGWNASRRGDLVVYCAHDAVFAEGILRAFEQQSGLRVVTRYDTEATKSLGLVELLVREAGAPRCDVFWNNEVLGTMNLQQRDLLEPYRGSGFARIPERFKDPDGHWTGFAARLRVIIRRSSEPLSSDEVRFPEVPSNVERWAIAKPLYGTTLTHYAGLWQSKGRASLVAWHRTWRKNGGRELNGNAAVKDAVAQGACDFGYTDTDDFFAAKDGGSAVEMQPARLPGGQTICIPNTVAIVRRARHLAASQRLVDFLLSEQTELALARSAARQIPLGPVPSEALPPEMRELREWAAESIPMADLPAAREECLAWLKSEYLR